MKQHETIKDWNPRFAVEHGPIFFQTKFERASGWNFVAGKEVAELGQTFLQMLNSAEKLWMGETWPLGSGLQF